MKPVTVHPPFGDNAPAARLFYGVPVLDGLRQLTDNSVHTACTSPPYWGLRDYGVDPQQWPRVEFTPVAGVPAVDIESQSITLGLEDDPMAYVGHLVLVFRELARVLRSDGTLWLNLGDSYAGSNASQGGDGTSSGLRRDGRREAVRVGSNRRDQERFTSQDTQTKTRAGLKNKDLVGTPWRVAMALQADGWYLRSVIPWIKRNPMPESVRDRPSSGVEYIFLFGHPASGGRYFYDADAIRAPVATPGRSSGNIRRKVATHNEEDRVNSHLGYAVPWEDQGVGRGRRNTDWFFESLEHILDGGQGLLLDPDGDPMVAGINPKPFPGAHFAVWPTTLVEPMVKAGTSEHGVCAACGTPWRRAVGRREAEDTGANVGGCPDRHDGGHREVDPTGAGGNHMATRRVGTDQWKPGCDCDAELGRAVVLDLFAGSGSTGVVATQLGREFVGIDLNADYLEIAEARITNSPVRSGEPHVEEGSVFDLFS